MLLVARTIASSFLSYSFVYHLYSSHLSRPYQEIVFLAPALPVEPRCVTDLSSMVPDMQQYELQLS